MTETDALRKRLQEIRWQLKGEARLAALEGHLAAVEADGDRPLRNAVLRALVECYEFSADPTRLLVPFSRLLHEYDTAPEHFDAALVRSVHWQFKWVVTKLVAHPEVPLASIEDWLGQLRTRYAEAGHSLHPCHAAEHWFAHHIGDHERAARAAANLASTEPDDMSDCETCRVSYAGAIAAAAGDHERALAAWAPILEGLRRCAHEPHNTLADSLLPLAALGRLDEARANHHHGYRISRDKDDMVHYVARHVRFCALTGNEARAVEILAANRRVFGLAFSPEVRLELLEGVQATAAALRDRGLGDTALPGPEERDWTADELWSRTDAERRELCARYDRRNGNDVQSHRSDLRVEPGEPYPHVPLGLKAMPGPPPPKPAAPATGDGLGAALDAARRATEHADEDARALWREAGRLAAALDRALDPADEAEVLLARAEPEADAAAAQELAERAAARFAEAGSPGRALLCRTAAATWGMRLDPESGAARTGPLLEEADALAEDDPSSAARARARLLTVRLHAVLLRGGEPDEALRSALAAADADLAAQSGDRRALRARVDLMQAAAEREDGPQARFDAHCEALELAVEAGLPYETFAGAAQCAAILNEAGQPADALEYAKTGLAAFRTDHPPFAVATLHLTAAECALDLGDREAAEAYALQAAHWYDRAGETGRAGAARHLLGRALAAQGRRDEAVVILEAALADLPSLPEEERWRLADARYLLAECFQAVYDPRTGLVHAVEALRMVEAGTAHPNPGFYALAAHLAGELLEAAGDSPAAVEAYRRAERAWREHGDLSAAAYPIRAAVWAGVRADEGEAAGADAAMAALEAELRDEWRNGERRPEYRESCRVELVTTLLQHSRLVDPGGGSPEEWALRFGEAALAVIDEGEPLPEAAVEAAHRLIGAHAGLGDLAGAEAAAGRVLSGLDPDRHGDLRSALERRLAFARRRAEG
jgi:tetratricopeptide (TPR) repeat protein